MSKHKNTGGLVYSTNPDYVRENEQKENAKTATTLPPAKQNLRITRDKKNRSGKEVTLISGFTGSETDLTELSKTLKTKCGTGGTVKDGEILIQGDFRVKVQGILTAMGYKARSI